MGSDVLRRYALAFRHDQTTAIAGAIAHIDPALAGLVAVTHAAVLVAVPQSVADNHWEGNP